MFAHLSLSVRPRLSQNLVSFFDGYIDVFEGGVKNLLLQIGYHASFYGLAAAVKRGDSVRLIHAMKRRILISDSRNISRSGGRRLSTECKLILVFLGATLRSHTCNL